MAESTTGYAFDRQFQDRILALCLQNRTFYVRNQDFIRPEFFEVDTAVRIVRVLRAWLENHKGTSIPDQITVRAMVRQYYAQARLPREAEEAAIAYLNELYQLPIADADAVAALVKSFGSMNEVLQCQQDVLVGIEQGWTAEQATQRMQAAVTACSRGTSLGMAGAEMLTDISKLCELRTQEVGTRRVTTGLPQLDSRIGGGVGPGQLVVVIAPPKTGKTTTLVCFGAAALEQDAVVYHATNEMTEDDIMVRYAACISGIPYTQFMSGNTEVLAEYRAMQAIRMEGRMRCRLYVKYWPPQGASAATIKAWMLQTMTETGHQPDVLIVDWADRLRSMSYSKDDSWGRLGCVYEELISLSGEMGCASYTASQPKRESYRNEYIHMEDAAGSIQKVEQADVVLTLNQTSRENREGKLRLLLAANRRGPQGWVLPCDLSYEAVSLVQSGAPYPVEDGAGGAAGRDSRGTQERRPWRE